MKSIIKSGGFNMKFALKSIIKTAVKSINDVHSEICNKVCSEICNEFNESYKIIWLLVKSCWILGNHLKSLDFNKSHVLSVNCVGSYEMVLNLVDFRKSCETMFLLVNSCWIEISQISYDTGSACTL